MTDFNGQAERQALQALLQRIIRIGNVSARFPKEGAVQVEFRDAGPEGTPTWKCPVIQPKTKADKAYWMPDKGERVVVLSLPQGPEMGLVVGAFYNERDSVPAESNDKAQVTFQDGTVVFYDREESLLKVEAKGEVTITAEDNVNVETQGDVTVTTDGKATVEAAKKALITGNAGVEIDGGPGANMDVLVHPKALSDFTGKPIQPPSSTVKGSP